MNTSHIRSRRSRLRMLELSAFLCLVALVAWVYVAKATGADERATIRNIESDIRSEQRDIRRLRAEAATLEQPARLEALVREHTDLAPVEPINETRPENLDAIVSEVGHQVEVQQ
ncbi:MAG: hypothetical protein J0L52_10950 [Caulobacterales bacterium]|nr:hypothetical protein [Caulobacterales bacterium]